MLHKFLHSLRTNIKSGVRNMDTFEVLFAAQLYECNHKFYCCNIPAMTPVDMYYWCVYVFLVLRDHGVYMYVVYILKWSSAHALGGVSGVASIITTDERLQWNRGCCFLVQAMLPEGFPFHQFNFTLVCVISNILSLADLPYGRGLMIF